MRTSSIHPLSGAIREGVATEQKKQTRMNHMNLNAYVLAMAITGKFTFREEPPAVPEPEFEPFDLRYLGGLPLSSNQPRRTSRDAQSQRDVPEALPA
jgi:hypothetical protein